MRKILNTALVLLLALSGCKENKEYIKLTEDAAPAPVSNVRVENMPGAAKIFYSLPSDESLRYVRAEYEIRPGEFKEAKSSNYTNYVVVDGFPNTEEHEVRLYAVSNGEKSSSVVTVKIKPLTPPLLEVFNTLQFRETFGGVSVTYQNQGEASMAVTLVTPNSTGEMSEVDTYYSKAKEGKFFARGFEAVKRKFGAIVRDRWGNLSDTAYVELTPVFEELIPKPFQTYNLPTDSYEAHLSGHSVDKLWDNITGPVSTVGLHTKPGAGMPQHFTFDMKVKSKLSRYKLFHRGSPNSYAYKLGAPKKWEIWGSNNPDPQGGWGGWEKLMDCESFKPSGNPVGVNTDEDNIYASTTGEDFTFPEEAPAVRYIRFKTLETWDYLDYIYIAELTFWGKREE